MPTVLEAAVPVGVCLAVALLVQFVKLLVGWLWPGWRDGRARRPFFRGLALVLGVAIGWGTLSPDVVPGLHPALVGLVCGGLSEFVYRLIRPWLSDRFQGRRVTDGGVDG